MRENALRPVKVGRVGVCPQLVLTFIGEEGVPSPRTSLKVGTEIMTVSQQTQCQDQTEAIRAGFELALKKTIPTLGATAPNPSVGCVLLDQEGCVLSVGVHEAAGQPHAEVMALEQAYQEGTLERAHTALVTLEPCAHHGRTPPCSERLRQSPVQAVWIGARDPNPVAAGGGASLAQGEGAKKVVFLDDKPAYREIAQQCRALLAPFACRVTKDRPWLTVKQALDRSGSMIPPKGTKTFTSSQSLLFAHHIRRATDAVITGIGTVLADDPSFTVRHLPDHAHRHKRLLIVLGGQGRLPEEWRKAREHDGFDVRACSSLEAMLVALRDYGANWALIEAGPSVLRSIKEANLWDDWLTIHQQANDQDDRLSWQMRDGSQKDMSPLSLLHIGGK